MSDSFVRLNKVNKQPSLWEGWCTREPCFFPAPGRSQWFQREMQMKGLEMDIISAFLSRDTMGRYNQSALWKSLHP